MPDSPTAEQDRWVSDALDIDPAAYRAADAGGGQQGDGGSPPPAIAAADDAVADDDHPESESLLKRIGKDAGLVVGSAIGHIAAGAVPGGVVGITPTDALMAAKGSSEDKFWWGVGATVGAVVDGVAAIGEVTGGVLASVPTAGVSLAITAEGVNEAVAGAEAMGAGVSLMAAGSANGGGGGNTPRPNKNAGKPVKDILKDKKGSIRNAPLEKGSPSWDDIQNMSWEEIDAAAKADRPGFRTIRKLLTDKRFDK